MSLPIAQIVAVQPSSGKGLVATDLVCKVTVYRRPDGELLVELREGMVHRMAGRQRITPVDMSRIPTAAGGGNLGRYLQTPKVS